MLILFIDEHEFYYCGKKFVIGKLQKKFNSCSSMNNINMHYSSRINTFTSLILLEF